MWSTQKKEIARAHIVREHLNYLRVAIEDAGDFDPRTPEVYDALDFLESQCAKLGGLNLYRRGLTTGNLLMMQSGFQLIRKQLGGR